jgi:hypothetical protein
MGGKYWNKKIDFFGTTMKECNKHDNPAQDVCDLIYHKRFFKIF